MFKKDEYNKIINELRTTEDNARRSELLQSLDNDYNEVIATADKNTATIKDLQSQNERLQQANNSLWLERTATQTNVNNDNNNVNNDNNGGNNNPPEKINIDTMFD